MLEETPAAPGAELPVKKRRGRQRGSRNMRAGREQTHEPTREPMGRAERIPLGSLRQKLLASKIPGFELRWINDDGARIQQALQGGWFFVSKSDAQAQTTDPGEALSQIVGTKEGGAAMRGYLMKIREEWYREDQAAKQDARKKVEAQIQRGKDDFGEPGQDGRYVREGGRRFGLK